jgi:hypothetical protein
MCTLMITHPMRRALPVLLLLAVSDISGCSSSSEDCTDWNVTVGVPDSQPTVTVIDSVTGMPICDAVIQILHGMADPNPAGPAIMMPSSATLGPWSYSDAGPHFPQNQLGPFEACQYGNSVDMSNYGSYTLLVTKVGYQSVEVSNVLVVERPHNPCGGYSGPPPPPQIVSVALTPSGS